MGRKVWAAALLLTAGILAIVIPTTVVLVRRNESSNGNGSSTSGSVSSSPDTSTGGEGGGGGGSNSSTGGGSTSWGGGSSGGGGNASGAGPDRGVLPPVPVALASICLDGFGIYFNGTPTGLETNDTLVKQCQILCQKGECCHLPANFDASCARNPANDDTCANYRQACGVLSVPSGGAIVDDPVRIPAPPENLDELCAINQMIRSSGRSSCAIACGPAACCYQDGHSSSCLLSNAADCALYQSCQNLQATATLSDQLAADIRQVCDAEHTTTKQGRMKCRNVCKLGTCCYVGNRGCGTVNPDPNFCAVQYQPCHVLYDGSLPRLANDTYDSPGLPDSAGQDDYMDDDNYVVDDQEPGGRAGQDDTLDDDDFVDDAYATAGANS
jgi:hypothetical protein